MDGLKKDDPVLFGRKNGQKTKGTIVKVNQKSYKVRTDEVRGVQKTHAVGKVWGVPKSLTVFDKSRAKQVQPVGEDEPRKLDLGPNRVPIASGLDSEKFRGEMGKTLKERDHLDYQCYMLLRELLESELIPDSDEDYPGRAHDLIAKRDEANGRFMMAAAGRAS